MTAVGERVVRDTYLAKLVKRCLTPADVESALRRRPDGKPVWEEV